MSFPDYLIFSAIPVRLCASVVGFDFKYNRPVRASTAEHPLVIIHRNCA
jgi:hypothetical protein